MIRMRVDLDTLSPQVKDDVCKNSQNEEISLMDMGGAYVQHLVPFEIKITKAKEGKKNAVKFHLFSGINLKIYDTLSEFFMDLAPYKTNSTKLRNHIDLLGMSSSQQIGQYGMDSFEINLI